MIVCIANLHIQGPSEVWTCPRGKATKVVRLGSYRYDGGAYAVIDDSVAIGDVAETGE